MSRIKLCPRQSSSGSITWVPRLSRTVHGTDHLGGSPSFTAVDARVTSLIDGPEDVAGLVGAPSSLAYSRRNRSASDPQSAALR
jgi:hypothetical protein